MKCTSKNILLLRPAERSMNQDEAPWCDLHVCRANICVARTISENPKCYAQNTSSVLIALDSKKECLKSLMIRLWDHHHLHCLFGSIYMYIHTTNACLSYFAFIRITVIYYSYLVYMQHYTDLPAACLNEDKTIMAFTNTTAKECNVMTVF